MPEAPGAGAPAVLVAPVGAAAPVGPAAGEATAAPGAPGDGGWERMLDELEARLVAWWAALRGVQPFPPAYTAPPLRGPLPAHLRSRALALAAAQRDVEEEIRARRAALGTLLRGIGTTDRRPPVPVFVDDRA